MEDSRTRGDSAWRGGPFEGANEPGPGRRRRQPHGSRVNAGSAVSGYERGACERRLLCKTSSANERAFRGGPVAMGSISFVSAKIENHGDQSSADCEQLSRKSGAASVFSGVGSVLWSAAQHSFRGALFRGASGMRD